MKMEKLTDSRINAMSEVAAEWLAHGLATGPADRDEAEAGVAEAYRAAGLEPPTMFVWLDSPLAGVVGSWALSGAKDKVRDQVGVDLWDGVEMQVLDQVGGRAGHQAVITSAPRFGMRSVPKSVRRSGPGRTTTCGRRSGKA
ncbi:hypothetical protein [Streptomyces sp. NPDC056468]|uniref:hypothetical protein n=1 Tax=Streptomyces sp. NPDC056468 TaxID=3345830 RepID=UPI0036A7269E